MSYAQSDVAASEFPPEILESAHAVRDSADLVTSGQQCLALIEAFWAKSSEIIGSFRGDDEPGSRRKRRALRAFARAAGVVQDDVEMASTLARIPEYAAGLRDGTYRDVRAAHAAWRASGAQGAMRQPTKNSKQRSYCERRELTPADKAWVVSEAARIVDDVSTAGQRSLAMTRALIARGLVAMDRFGGPGADSETRKWIEKELGIHVKLELAAALTVLRKAEAGEITVESVESGRHSSCSMLLQFFKRRKEQKERKERKEQRRRHVKTDLCVARSMTWYRDRAKALTSEGSLQTPTQKAIAYQEVLVAERVLDPRASLSKAIATARKAAASILKVAEHEFTSCWYVLRAVAKRELPAEALAPLKDGVTSAQWMTRGGIPALAKSMKSALKVEPAAPAKLAVAPAGARLVVSEVVGLKSAAKVASQNGALEALMKAAAGVCSELNGVVSAAEAEGDDTVVSLASRAREAITLVKVAAQKLTNRRFVAQRNVAQRNRRGT